jgi:hypothetical protein
MHSCSRLELTNSLIMMVNTAGGVHHRGFNRHPGPLAGLI